jgi:hypothetical protein
VTAQRIRLVRTTEQTSLLQDWHDLIDEHVELRRQYRRHDVETVRGATFDPVGDNVGHAFGRPGDRKVSARASELMDQLAQGRTLACHEMGDDRWAILLAGGIGVTPLKSMAHSLDKRGVECELHYCARDASCAAFHKEFKDLLDGGRLHYHFDGGDPTAGPEIDRLLSKTTQGTHVYLRTWGIHEGVRGRDRSLARGISALRTL